MKKVHLLAVSRSDLILYLIKISHILSFRLADLIFRVAAATTCHPCGYAHVPVGIRCTFLPVVPPSRYFELSTEPGETWHVSLLSRSLMSCARRERELCVLHSTSSLFCSEFPIRDQYRTTISCKLFTLSQKKKVRKAVLRHNKVVQYVT